MTFNDSSSIILIVGAIAILAFVVHGLWFSGRSINRKLVKNSKEDQEIALSSAVGKVRIIMPKSENSQNDTTSAQTKVETFVNKTEPKISMETTGFENEVHNQVQMLNTTYELNLFSSNGRPYKGLDLEELFNTYGFIRGEKNIYCVYEDPSSRENVVFRICSLEAPYSFPENMSEFSTHSIAIYMQLPPKGKASIYFKAMRIGANCLIEHLGGVIKDNDNKELSDDKLDLIEASLKQYDKSEE